MGDKYLRNLGKPSLNSMKYVFLTYDPYPNSSLVLKPCKQQQAHGVSHSLVFTPHVYLIYYISLATTWEYSLGLNFHLSKEPIPKDTTKQNSLKHTHTHV